MNGLGFVALREATAIDVPRQIIDANPDIVIVTLGLNDAYSFDRIGGGIRDRIRDDFDRLATSLPHARIVVVEPFWYSSDRPASLDVVSEWVKEGAERIGADHVPGASEWIRGRDGEMAADGLHPNDAGYDVLFRPHGRGAARPRHVGDFGRRILCSSSKSTASSGRSCPCGRALRSAEARRCPSSVGGPAETTPGPVLP